MAYYPVYLVESLGAPRNHHALFVETPQEDNKCGVLFQVKGNIMNGMTYETKDMDTQPDHDAEFLSKSQLGSVRAEDLPCFDSICSANPPPEKQFDGLKRISKKPLRRCQEWTHETIESLKAKGVLVGSSD